METYSTQGGHAPIQSTLLPVRSAHEMRDASEAEGWLCAGLCLARLQPPTSEALGPTLPWVLAAISEAPALPPAGMIVDVGLLLRGRAPDFSAALAVPDVRLRAALRGYEEQVLGRLAGEPLFDAACDAVAKLDAGRRPEGIALLVEQVLGRLGFGEAVAVNPGVARRLLRKPVAELLELGLGELLRTASGARTVETLAAGYEALTHASRHVGTLLSAREVFTLENLTVLGSLTRRMAVDQIVEAAHLLERALPGRLRRTVRRHGGTPTNIEDDSVYPTGGFSAISTSGSVESLVSSELVYMEDGEEIDLFDVRYAEGELLYYTRDESVFVRQQRTIAFVLDADLVAARIKDATLPWQRLVILLGLILCAVQRLADWLRHEALTIRVVFLRDGGAMPLAGEQELARLLLREWIDNGVARVEEAAQLADVLAELTAISRKADCSLVALADRASPRLPPHGRVHWVTLRLEPGWPELRGATLADPEAGDGATWETWREATQTLLQQLV